MYSNDYYFPKQRKRNLKRYCKILSSASFIPEKVISNQDIIQQYNLPFKSSIIAKTTGVETRHVAEEHMADSDVLCLSAKECLDKADILPEQLSRLLVNKYYGDNLLPMTASRLLGKLGTRYAVHAFDIDGGVSAFLYSIDAIASFMNAGDDYILLSSGGIHTRMIDKTDPRTAFLFGDASASLLFAPSEEKHILSSYFYTNYNYYDLAYSNMIPFVTEDVYNIVLDDNGLPTYGTYKLGNWKDAEEFYRQAVREIASNILSESSLHMEDIDLILVTENNKGIWELTLETLGVSADKSISVLKNYGNTMTAMLPMLMDIGFKSGKIQPGMNIMMISHGEGFNGGGLIYKV